MVASGQAAAHGLHVIEASLGGAQIARRPNGGQPAAPGERGDPLPCGAVLIQTGAAPDQQDR
jgi:hypothetical protein